MSLPCGILDTCFGTHFWDTQFFLTCRVIGEKQPGLLAKQREVSPETLLCSPLTGSLGNHALFWSPEGCPWALPSLYYLGPACENLLGKNPRAW